MEKIKKWNGEDELELTGEMHNKYKGGTPQHRNFATFASGERRVRRVGAGAALGGGWQKLQSAYRARWERKKTPSTHTHFYLCL